MLVNGKHTKTVWFEDGVIKLVNQPLLPHSFEIVHLKTYLQVADAIKTMVVRGAPAIGATAAYGMALAHLAGEDLDRAAEALRQTRPTAQDLFYAVDTVLNAANAGKNPLDTARRISRDYETACETIGDYGAELIEDGIRLNTHCNAGWLATVDWGTATAPMYKAKRQGKNIFVFVDETRPRCQGARITAFELGHEGIDHAVIADNAAGHYMWRGEIDLVIVGADRVAANGDIANKIGTYSSAVVAAANSIPFYVAAPAATIDMECPDGLSIPIEERGPEEVSGMFGKDPESGRPLQILISPESSAIRNPAFDVTPASYITAIITERGIFKPKDIRGAFGS